MKLGILGGSFNPVHLGHLFIADKVISALKLDRVVMIPANISPFKQVEEGISIGCSSGDRLEMLAAAVAGDSRLTIDDCEIRREGVSYTIDTLKDITARYIPDDKPFLIIGDDLADDFPKWRDSAGILSLADIVIARRFNSAKKKYPFPNISIVNDVMDISSHMIRQMISEGKDWKSLMPSAVAAIIKDKRLYGYTETSSVTEDCSYRAILRIEKEARETLTMERFLHSRNTAVLAGDLCRRFGLDPVAGYLAGIAHDLCKQLDPKNMLKLVKSDGRDISSLEKDRPNLLHGRAAAVLLTERFSIHNKDILEAVACHTSGSEDMGPLAKVIYIADKTEVSRNIDPALRKMLRTADLDSILFAVVKKTISKLQSKELDLSEDTLKLLERMKERNS
uniref:Probable nicotinate-nucleotide adenylyltransferase n=1 Tax=uncultured bacterium contig00042 TaxID=1181529 RepID=A0A806JZJ3_9BACT|nr:nicotinate-nucleotide adenylyltransferase bacterial NadD family protein [uncultured bacterium contig00042]